MSASHHPHSPADSMEDEHHVATVESFPVGSNHSLHSTAPSRPTAPASMTSQTSPRSNLPPASTLVPANPISALSNPRSRRVRHNYVRHFVHNYRSISSTSKFVFIATMLSLVIQVVVVIVVLVISRDEACLTLRLLNMAYGVRAFLALPVTWLQYLSPWARIHVRRRERAQLERRRASEQPDGVRNPVESTGDTQRNHNTNADTHRANAAATGSPRTDGSSRLDNRPNAPSTSTLSLDDEIGNTIPSTALWIDRIKSVLDFTAILLFVMGNYWVIADPECRFQAPALYFTTLALVVLGYLVFFSPIILFGAVIMCLPCVLVVMRVMRLTGDPASAVDELTEITGPGPMFGGRTSLTNANGAAAAWLNGRRAKGWQGLTEDEKSRLKEVRYQTRESDVSRTEKIEEAPVTPLAADEESAVPVRADGQPKRSGARQVIRRLRQAFPLRRPTALNTGTTPTTATNHASSSSPNETTSPSDSPSTCSPESCDTPSTTRGSPFYIADPTDAHCTICLSDYRHDERLRLFPCGHHFHLSCADEWLSSSRKCPLCQRDVTLKLPAPAEEARAEVVVPVKPEVKQGQDLPGGGEGVVEAITGQAAVSPPLPPPPLDNTQATNHDAPRHLNSQRSISSIRSGPSSRPPP